MQIPQSNSLLSTKAPNDILYKPLEDLKKHQDELVIGSNILQKASRSSLYQSLWNKKGVKPDLLLGREGIQLLPCIDSKNLVSMLKDGRSINNAILKKPRFWLISRGTQGTKKWFPVTENDIEHWFNRIRRINDLFSIEGHDSQKTVLAINEPLPRVSNAVPYLWEQVDYHIGGARLEWLIVSMEMLPRNHWDKFVIQKQPEWIMSSVEDALGLANQIKNDGDVEIKNAIPCFERGFFWGTNLDGDEDFRSKLESRYGLPEVFSIYLSAECREMYVECKSHQGLHLWMDGVIHEILLSSGEILFVDEADGGMEGEYIVTTFSESLPLVRYKTGDIVRVVDTKACECGITHPRVEFLGRVGNKN